MRQPCLPWHHAGAETLSYVLVKENHQNWHVEGLWQALLPLLPGISIEVLARAESTNSALLERVRVTRTPAV